MGIVLSALAGAAGGYDAAMDQDRKEREAAATDVRRSGLEEQRQRALLLFKNQQEDVQRSAMTDRVNQAAGSIADQAVSQKRGIVTQGIADQSSWTPDMQASVDQSLALDRGKMVTDPRTLRDAAIRTGDIDPKTAATLADSERRLDTADNKAAAIDAASERKDVRERERMERKDATDNERMDRRDKIEAEKISLAEKRLELMERRQENGGSGKLEAEERKRYTTLYNDAGRQMVESQKTLRKLQSDFMYQNAPKGSTQAQELEDLKTAIGEHKKERELYGSLLAGGAGKTDDATAPASPAPAPAASSQRNGEKPGILDGDPKELSYRRGMLQKELDKALAAGNQADADSVRKEMSRLPGATAPRPVGAASGTRPPLSSFQR